MRISCIRSDKVYAKIAEAPEIKKNDIYRHELMSPFKSKWDAYNIPMKAASENGYDIIMASAMLGHLPPKNVDESQRGNIAMLSNDSHWNIWQGAIETSLDKFISAGIDLPVKEYLFTVLLANPANPYIMLSKGYCGDGGIPGYIFGWLEPSEYTLARMPSALAHETNHNVRYQFIKWNNNITLGEMLVSEGLAENFATELFGEQLAGPWVSGADMDELREYIKPLIHDALSVQGFENITSYLYGDDIAKLQSYIPVGLPYCAGYICGYHLIKHYLAKTGKSVIEATIIPADEILAAAQDFWNN